MKPMSARIFATCAVLAFAIASASAHADIYTWIDKKGLTNVSNLPPPDGAKVTNVLHTAPKDAAREAAARDAARQSELRALNERVQQLQAEVEQARREPPIGFAYAPPPPMPYAAPSATPVVVNVMQSPAAAPSYTGGCDYTWGDCGSGLWPGFFGSTVVVGGGGRNKPFRRPNVAVPSGGQQYIVPPLIPPPPSMRGNIWR